MAYFLELQSARQWLLRHRCDDGGWGMVPGQPSSMVNTAEALFVLAKAGAPLAECMPSIAFIEREIDEHIRKRGPRTRYVALPLMTLAECFPEHNPLLQQSWVEWLYAAQNSDDGWGDAARNEDSDLFSTYLVIEALSIAGALRDEARAAGRWILARSSESGWSLHGQSLSISGTAYALQGLVATNYSDTPAFRIGREFLLSASQWDNEEVVIIGTKWLHCRAAAVLRALAKTDTDPFHPTVADAIRTFQRCILPGSGWMESPSDNTPTVRSQYWAASSISVVHDVFDPAIYIPRAEAERTQSTLIEPYYLPFATGTKYHFIVPASLFRVCVWVMLVGGLAVSAGMIERLPPISPKAAIPVGVAVAVGAVALVRKRPKQFPRLSKMVGWIVPLAIVLGTLYGLSASQIIVLIASKSAEIIKSLAAMIWN